MAREGENHGIIMMWELSLSAVWENRMNNTILILRNSCILLGSDLSRVVLITYLVALITYCHSVSV